MKKWWKVMPVMMPVVFGAGMTGCRARTMEVTESYIVAPAGDAPAVMYFRVHNGTGVPDTLLGVTTDVAQRAELHREMAGAMGAAGTAGMSLMAPVERIPLAADETLRFVPGGYHVMLIGPTAMRRGAAVPVTVRFIRTGKVPAIAHVIGYADVDSVIGTSSASQ